MKKLMGISVIAMLAVAAGFSAHAADVAGTPEHYAGSTPADVLPGEVEPLFKLAEVNTATDGNAASAGYVKGAYNAAIKAINKVNQNTKVDAGNGIDKTNNTVSVKAATNGGIAVDANGVAVDAGNGIELGADGVAVKSADSSVTVNASGVAVHVDGSTVEVNSTNGVQVKDGGITTAKIADEAVTVAKIEQDDIAKGTDTYATLTDLANQGYVDQKVAIATDGMVTLDGTQELSNKTLNGGTLKTGTTLTATGATISGGTITGATIDSANNTISNIVVGDMATTAVAGSSAQTATNDKLTTKDYVDEAVAGLNIDNYATKTGVDNTINALSTTVNNDFTLTSGAVTGRATIAIMQDWSNPNTATTLDVNTSNLAVATDITEGTVTINKTAYASVPANANE